LTSDCLQGHMYPWDSKASIGYRLETYAWDSKPWDSKLNELI